MTNLCSAFVIAGVSSNVGKTSISLGLARAATRAGMTTQTFKVGPDYLDPGYLARASGRPCFNLDAWMSSPEYVRMLFSRKMQGARVGLVEGVMGLFDGAFAGSLEGSSAQIARLLNLPVFLVVDASGMAGSIAALVKGYAQFASGLNLAGVIANRCGSQGHVRILNQALELAGLPRLVGHVIKGALPTLKSRHLGLVSATANEVDNAFLDRLADACCQGIDLDELLAAAPRQVLTSTNRQGDQDNQAVSDKHPASGLGQVRIGIARDEAFHFYYPDTLQALREQGARLVEFSPLHDPHLPPGLHGLYLGGGYPEVHARQLADNCGMLADVRDFAATNRPVYAECGGLMYLGESIDPGYGTSLDMTGVLPIKSRLLKRLQRLGYVEVKFCADTLWGPKGKTVRGHEFHFSRVISHDCPAQGFTPAYSATYARGDAHAGSEPKGWCKGNILASYIHLHLGAHPRGIEHFVKLCKENQ